MPGKKSATAKKSTAKKTKEKSKSPGVEKSRPGPESLEHSAVKIFDRFGEALDEVVPDIEALATVCYELAAELADSEDDDDQLPEKYVRQGYRALEMAVQEAKEYTARLRRLDALRQTTSRAERIKEQISAWRNSN